MSTSNSIIGLAGDILVDRDNPDEVFDLIRDVLAVPDLLSANCECAYATNVEHSPGVTVPVSASPENIPAIARAGFDLVTLANNHALDAGHRGMFEMHKHLEAAGIAHVGTGKNLADSRKPAYLKAGDNTVAFLAYATFFPRGYEALHDWPGLAPMRAHNHYRDLLPNVWSPGTPPVASTVPVQEDMDNLAADIANAKKNADIVVVQFHGGDYKHPFVLSDHEIRCAHFAIDHGADVVAGHHHHVLRGVEWYKGAPIFYGLGHFVFDLQTFRGPKEIVTEGAFLDPETDETYMLAPRKGWPWLPWHRDARMTALAWVSLSGSKVDQAGFLPCMLNKTGQVYAVDANSAEGKMVGDYILKGSSSQGFKMALGTEGAPAFGTHRAFTMVKSDSGALRRTGS
jgi:poly-gamma-glutamate capsule biosynthesis protein CapA/YwtB (metallophosphatase superfamily)